MNAGTMAKIYKIYIPVFSKGYTCDMKIYSSQLFPSLDHQPLIDPPSAQVNLVLRNAAFKLKPIKMSADLIQQLEAIAVTLEGSASSLQKLIALKKNKSRHYIDVVSQAPLYHFPILFSISGKRNSFNPTALLIT